MFTSTEYPKVRQMTTEEALDINGEELDAIREEYSTGKGWDDYVNSLRESEQGLEEINLHLEEYVMAYEKDREDREPVESIYALKIALLQGLAKRLHPMSDYGREKLFASIKCREEFEMFVGPMVTLINKENIDLFKTVLSADIREEILTEKRFALGALRTQHATTYGVGAIVYHLDFSLDTDLDATTDEIDNGTLWIDWLFVNPQFRHRGVASQLIGDLMGQMLRIGIDRMYAEFSNTIEDKSVMAYLFGSWHFDLDTEIDPDAVICLGDISYSETVNRLAKGVNYLSSNGGAAGNMIIKKTLQRFSYVGYLWGVPAGYIDMNLSCYAGSESNVGAILLAHKKPSGMIQVEYIGAAPGGEKYVPGLICAFIKKATLACDGDTIVRIPVDMEELYVLFEKITSNFLGQYLITGLLVAPTADVNLNAEDVKELLKATE